MKDKKTFLYRILWLPIVGVSKLFNCKIKNKEAIGNDAIILAGTHTSIFDCLMIIASTKRPVHFLAKKELFTGVKALLFKNMGLIPVDRSKKDGEQHGFMDGNVMDEWMDVRRMYWWRRTAKRYYEGQG